MSFLDGKGLSLFTKLIKDYIGIPWSMSGDTNDILIPASSNLDNYTTIGNYYCRPDSDAASITNNPSGSSFILKVYSGAGYSHDTSGGNYLTQHLEDGYGEEWKRYKTTGSWSSWVKTLTSTPDSVGSGTKPIYVNNGSFTASTSTVGSGTNPIYMNNGTLTALSSTVGSSTTPIYTSSGTITASSSTIGSGTKPIYTSSGTITASSSTVGSGTKPVYISSGTVTASSSTVGGTAKPVYLSSGTVTALSSTVGSGTKPVYMSSGTITASSSTVGGSGTPIYINNGVITACDSVGNVSISSYNIGSDSGYVKFSIGLIIQWGKCGTDHNVSTSYQEYAVSLPTSFSSSTSYGIVKNMVGTANDNGGTVMSETGFFNKTKSKAYTTGAGYNEYPTSESIGVYHLYPNEWLAIGS